jgi:hypothetical protein
LGVPQGSILGPILFLIFINDLPYFLDIIDCTMFADDTTFCFSNYNFDHLIILLKSNLHLLNSWCIMNKLDINWDKTEIMIIGGKSENLLKKITFNDIDIKVVSDFKLLGVTIDRNLTFSKHVANVKKNVLSRLFSIKNLFFLKFSVKLQFFKSFILPFFDYCLSLLVYYPKYSLQKLSNYYNICLFKLLNIKYNVNNSDDLNTFNNILSKYNLYCFQHRILKKLALFSYNILNNPDGPSELKKCLIRNCDIKNDFRLRSSMNFSLEKTTNLNKYGFNTFGYIFPKLINNLFLTDINLNYKFFLIRIVNNINLLLNKFVVTFSKFNLNYSYLLFKKL